MLNEAAVHECDNITLSMWIVNYFILDVEANNTLNWRAVCAWMFGRLFREGNRQSFDSKMTVSGRICPSFL